MPFCGACVDGKQAELFFEDFISLSYFQNYLMKEDTTHTCPKLSNEAKNNNSTYAKINGYLDFI